ncbi:unnamed protein product [Ambrosiozyma monospora]|uniref:Unnamed protein product n=1 Tax=Ambrosiozyma monospora TaxID=43982 RepID=A0ACB5TRZ9_AMBMO|nr:unnamed protein product [Ambrosiozyma monospora]
MRLLKEYKLNDVLLDNRSSEDIRFEDLVTSMINKRFELGCDKPLWNLIIYDKRTLVLYGDHLVGDGTSFRNFHTEFLKCLKEASSGEIVDGLSYTGLDSTIYRESQFATRDIYPAQNKIINYWVTPQYFAWCVLKYLIPSLFILFNMLRPKNKYEPKKENPFFVEESNQAMRREYHLKFINVSSDNVNKLLKLSRRYNVKLTSLLINIGLLAISPITGNHDVALSIPANIRGRINHKKAHSLCNNFTDMFGLYMGEIEIDIESLQNLGIDKRLH